MTKDEPDDGPYEFLGSYYRSGSPENAPEALAHFITSECLARATPDGLVPARYMFGRIAEGRPAIIRGYEAALPNADFEGRTFILGLLGTIGDDSTKSLLESLLNDPDFTNVRPVIEEELARLPAKERIDPLRRDIAGPADLDLLWGEFLVTGDRQAVRRIIQVLEWPDLVRKELETWMRSEPRLGFFRVTEFLKRGRLNRLRRLVGIDCDCATKRITSVEDLDCLCGLEKMEICRDRFRKAFKTLPFSFSGEQNLHVMTKIAAKWSLASNAKQHPRVLDVCEEEISKRDGRAKLALLEIAADARFVSAEHGAAAKWYSEYRNLNPLRRDAGRKLLIARSELKLDELMDLTSDSATCDDSVAGLRQLARNCADRTQNTEAFFTRSVVHDRANPEMESRGHVAVEWRVWFKAPDRYHVDQFMFPSDYDEWVSIGARTFQNAGLWFRAEDSCHDHLNRFLRGDPWFAFMRTGEPISGGHSDCSREGFQVIQYAIEDVGELLRFDSPLPLVSDIPGEIRVWINSSTEFLARAELTLRGRSSAGEIVDLDYRQAFTAHDGDISIEAPELDIM